jgi:hypothetical protein
VVEVAGLDADELARRLDQASGQRR